MFLNRHLFYTLLEEVDIPGIKNPDAFNYVNGLFSDNKVPEANKIKGALQNNIKLANNQGAAEVVFRLTKDYSTTDIYDGLKASLQPGRNRNIKVVILLRKDKKPLYLDAEKLREKFKGKK